MDRRVFERMLREGKITAEDVLRKTVADRVDDAMELLLRHRPYDEVQHALHERLCSATFADFKRLTKTHFKYFGHVPLTAGATRDLPQAYAKVAVRPRVSLDKLRR
jgi:hypothetical protein